MAAMVCHGLPSCLESQIVESRTTFRLSLPFSKTLTPPSLSLSQPLDLTFKSAFWDSDTNPYYSEETENEPDDKGGWSFHQVLSNICHGDSEDPSNEESVYVHPQVKRSSLVLSEKSLELCTENLGNETGTDIAGSSIELLSSSSEEDSGAGDSPTREQISSRAARGGLGGKKARTQDFPPPLTTMRGSESLRVWPHRENGRLVMKAVRVTSSGSCFQAERSHGRLRLRLLKNQTPWFDSEQNEQATESDMNEEEDEEDEEETEEVLVEEEEDDDDNEDEEGEESDDDDANEDEEGEESDLLKYERPRRCREGENENIELLNWESLWVTTTT